MILSIHPALKLFLNLKEKELGDED